MAIAVATAKNSIITFIPDITLGIAQFQFQGFSQNYILRLTNAENVTYIRGADGLSQASNKVTTVKGTFEFLATSPTLLLIQQYQTIVDLSGRVLFGTLEVEITSMNRKYLYPDFAVKSNVVGLPIGFDSVEPVEIAWESAPALVVQS